MVPGGLERVGQVTEQTLPAMEHGGYLAMHERPGPHHLAAKGKPHGLVPQANPQQGNPAGKMLDHRHGDPGFARTARPRRNDQIVGRQTFDLGQGDLVIAKHFDLLTQDPEILDQVIGKRIIVVDHQQHV
jgi:hypothetical protein